MTETAWLMLAAAVIIIVLILLLEVIDLMADIDALADKYRDMLIKPMEKVWFNAWLLAVKTNKTATAKKIRHRVAPMIEYFGDMMSADPDFSPTWVVKDYYLKDIHLWAEDMEKMYGPFVQEIGTNVGYTWEDALARHRYGVAWQDTMPAYPTKADVEAAQQWKAGSWPVQNFHMPWHRYTVEVTRTFTLYARSREEMLTKLAPGIRKVPPGVKEEGKATDKITERIAVAVPGLTKHSKQKETG